MPEMDYVWLPKDDVLDFEEISRLVDVFCSLGVDRVRLTGGEPLLRRHLEKLLSLLSAKPAVKDLAMTTNGILLAERARELKSAGLHRITVSLDTLRAGRFAALTRRGGLERVLEGLEAASSAGFSSVKIDTVVMRGTNDDELTDLIDLGRRLGAEVRFIEYMDVGGATRWRMDKVMSKQEILSVLARGAGPIEPVLEETSAPAQRYRLADGTLFGIIASTTTPFCQTCDRSRLTADGHYFTCLYSPSGSDLRSLIRGGASNQDLAEAITRIWTSRIDRGAEERLAMRERQALAEPGDLRKNPHLEMHTRGG